MTKKIPGLKSLSLEEIDRLLSEDESAHHVEFILAHDEFSLSLDKVFLLERETIASALFRTFNLDRVHRLNIQSICAQALSQCDRHNVSLSPDLTQKLLQLEARIPLSEVALIEDFVAIGRGLIRAGFKFKACSSQSIDQTLISFSSVNNEFEGDPEILAYFRPLLGL